jgi:hypothetical protein
MSRLRRVLFGIAIMFAMYSLPDAQLEFVRHVLEVVVIVHLCRDALNK